MLSPPEIGLKYDTISSLRSPEVHRMKMYLVYGHYDWESIYARNEAWLFNSEEKAENRLISIRSKCNDVHGEYFSIKELEVE